MFRYIALVFCCIYMQCATALNGFPVHEDAVELEQKISIEHKHHFALSKNKKIDGRWRFEKEQMMQGILIKTLSEINSEDTLSDIAAFYQTQLGQLDAKMLFQCKGRMCGSSNEWANAMFKESRLYGPDENQYFWALEYNRRFWSLYLIQRGNGRIYAYLEEVQPVNVEKHLSLILPAPCDINKELLLIRPFASHSPETFFLLYNKAGINTHNESQQLADACAVQIKQSFPDSKIRSVGLGEFDRLNKRRVSEDKIELIRFGAGDAP